MQNMEGNEMSKTIYQTSFDLANDKGSSEVIPLGVGYCFSYIHYIPSPIFDMRSNPNISYSISYITHSHAFNRHDTRQGKSFEKIIPIFSFSPHHLPPA